MLVTLREFNELIQENRRLKAALEKSQRNAAWLRIEVEKVQKITRELRALMENVPR